MENNEKQTEDEKEIWIPPDLSGLDFSTTSDISLSNVSSIVNIADTHLIQYQALLSDEILCGSEFDDSCAKSDEETVVDCQSFDKMTISSEKKNTKKGDEILAKNERKEDLKTRESGNVNKLILRMPSQNTSYNEQSEDDDNFSATDGSDYVSNSDENAPNDDENLNNLKKYTKKSAKVCLIDRINKSLSQIDTVNSTTSSSSFQSSNAKVLVMETPESSFQTSNGNVIVLNTPESSFENEMPSNYIDFNQATEGFSSLQLNVVISSLSDEPKSSNSAQIAHIMSNDTLDSNGHMTVSNTLITEDTHIATPPEQNRSGKRSWNRRNCCFYCENLVTNFTRHLYRNHQDEPEVLKLIAIRDSDPKIQMKKKRAITDELRNRGNYIYNSKVVSNKDGDLITARRANDDPKEIRSPSMFVVCRICLGTFKRSTFYRHSKKCGDTETKSNRSLVHNAISIIPDLKNASNELRTTILPRLRNDDISLIAKNDPLIISYGCRLLKKKKERRSRKVICSKMRDLAHLLNIIRKKSKDIVELQQIFDPKHYECFLEAVKEMCGYNEETGYVEVVSIPARLRPEILGCIEILLTETIMDNGKSTALKELIKTKLNDFKLLLEANWQWEISSNAEKSRKLKLMTKEKVMPVDEDIKTVIKKIHDLEEKYYENLKKDITIVNYENLCEVTIAHIILLDRKRSGDVAESELHYYLNRKSEEIPLKVYETLDIKQQEAISELDIFQIPGKRGRAVPVLLTKSMKRNIDLIITSRSLLKIPTTNKYLFARPITDEPFNGGKCLETIKAMCSLKKPKMFTSTGLRHHIATMSQVHAKSDDKYTEQLATFLGHDMSVHSNNYRLPLQAIQKGVVGSKLMEIEKFSEHNKRNDITLESDKENRTDEEVEKTNTPRNIDTDEEEEEKKYTKRRKTSQNKWPDKEVEKTNTPRNIDTDEEEEEKKYTKRRKTCRNKWTKEEISAVMRHLKKFITLKKNPGKSMCEEVLRKEPVLHKRTWMQINSYINNIYKKDLA